MEEGKEVSIRVFSDPKKLVELADVWNAMIRKCSGNPFLLSDFVKQFMKLYNSRSWIPQVLVISVDDTIVGVVPLMTKKRFGIRIVRFLLNPSFSPDFVIDDKHRNICISHVLDFLFRTLQCQYVDLSFQAESQNLPVLKQKCEAKNVFLWAEEEIGHSIIPIKDTWDEFRKLRGRNFRRKFNKIERNLSRVGSWRTISVENGNDKKSIVIEKVLYVDSMSWKEAWRSRRGMKLDEPLLLIWKASLCTAQNEPDFKWIVWFLDLDEKTLAYSLVIQYKDVAFIVKTSYDERYKRLYPGIYIMNEAIRETFHKGQVRQIDFLTDFPFHRTWTYTCLPRVRVVMTKSRLILILRHIMANVYVKKLFRIISNSLPVIKDRFASAGGF